MCRITYTELYQAVILGVVTIVKTRAINGTCKNTGAPCQRPKNYLGLESNKARGMQHESRNSKERMRRLSESELESWCCYLRPAPTGISLDTHYTIR
jgi:hypothetical protein